METVERNVVTVQVTVNAPVEKVWKYWNEPEHIKQWCFASPEWHAPHSENDLRKDGKLKTTMAAKDGSFAFDFEGTYTRVEQYKLIEYVLGDGRRVSIAFSPEGDGTKISETFDTEASNPIEMQRAGWQAILNNFKIHTERD